MNESKKRAKIISMLQHYFFQKPYFSLNLLERALDYLKANKNPFLYIEEEMNLQLKKKHNTHYQLSSEVFYIHLENDKQNIPESPNIPKSQIFAISLLPKDLLRCEICQHYTYVVYNNPDCLVFWCINCNEFFSFPIIANI